MYKDVVQESILKKLYGHELIFYSDILNKIV